MGRKIKQYWLTKMELKKLVDCQESKDDSLEPTEEELVLFEVKTTKAVP